MSNKSIELLIFTVFKHESKAELLPDLRLLVGTVRRQSSRIERVLPKLCWHRPTFVILAAAVEGSRLRPAAELLPGDYKTDQR